MPSCRGCRAPLCTMRSTFSSRRSCQKLPADPSSLSAFLSHLVRRLGGTRPFPLLFGSSGATPCEQERMHVLGHLWCADESIKPGEPSSFGGIERGSLTSEDTLFPCDTSRSSQLLSYPATSSMPSVVAPMVLDGAFPATRCCAQVRLIRHVAWRVSPGGADGKGGDGIGAFRDYMLE